MSSCERLVSKRGRLAGSTGVRGEKETGFDEGGLRFWKQGMFVARNWVDGVTAKTLSSRS